MKTITCAHCGKESEKRTGIVNRAIKLGKPLYCGRKCFGLASRNIKTPDQLKEEKRIYDMEYRRKNKALLKAKKAEYFQRTYDPERAAIDRRKTMRRHIEYCRTSEYKAWKKEYDRTYRAKKTYGEFWESFLLLMDVEQEVESRMNKYQIRLESETYNKTQRRHRDERSNSKKLEKRTMGNP